VLLPLIRMARHKMDEVACGGKSPPSTLVPADFDVAESQTDGSGTSPWLSKLMSWGVEVRGVKPVPLEERVDKRFINVFFVWFTMSTNLLP
jgi:hypothetical protein